MRKATVLFCTLLVVGFFVSTADAARGRLDQPTKASPQMMAKAATAQGLSLTAPAALRGGSPSASFAPCPGVDCLDPDLNSFSTSDAGMNYQVTDDTFGEAGTIDSLCFYGIYYDFNTGTACNGFVPTEDEDDFRVRFLDDIGGIPQNSIVIAQFDDLSCARAQDDLISWIGFYQYIYTCDINPGVDTELCESMWVEITNDMSFVPGSPYPGCAWLWTQSLMTNGSGPFQAPYDAEYTIAGNTAASPAYAFCTNVERLSVAGCTAPCTTDHTVDIMIQTDSWGSETSWDLTDLDTATVVCNGGPYPSNSQNNEQCCVDSNCLEFCIYDSYGDGIYSPGGYTVAFDGVEVCNTLGGQFTGYQDCSCTDIGGCIVVDPDEGACCIRYVNDPYNCVDGLLEADCLALAPGTDETYFAGAGTDCATAGCLAEPCVGGDPGSPGSP